MINVFVSRPNPFTNQQDYFLTKMINFLRENNFDVVTLRAKDYNPHESLSCLNEMIKRSYGIIILSFGQTYIENGTSKKESIQKAHFFDAQETNLNNTWITSPFCHIEGSIAFSNNLPMLILNQNGIKIEGILKEGTHAFTAPLFTLDSSENIDSYFQSNYFLSSFNQWKIKVEQLYNFIQHSTID